MAGRRDLGARPVLPESNAAVLDAYLVAFGSLLRGRARHRRRILDEVRNELEDATESYTSLNLPAPAAARAAVDDLGAPTELAAAFAGELATRLARRILWVLLLTGPFVGIWWLLLLAPAPWSVQPGLLIASIPVLPLIAAAIGVAIVGIATTGSLIRWLPEAGSRRALWVATAVTLACILGDVAMLSILAYRGVAGTIEALPLGLALTAIVASVTRLAVSVLFIRECLRARVALVGAGEAARG